MLADYDVCKFLMLSGSSHQKSTQTEFQEKISCFWPFASLAQQE